MPYLPGSNTANINSCASWNSQNGNVAAVGSNGGPSYYGTYDQNGNIWEWIETVDGRDSWDPFILRGGSWIGLRFFAGIPWEIDSTSRGSEDDPTASTNTYGFRVASLANPIDFIHFVDVTDINNSANTDSYGRVTIHIK
jgi:formylglycine-generating enzyme required for sulfatase activity